MYINYFIDTGAGTEFEQYLQQLAGTTLGITSDDTCFLVEGHIDGKYYPLTFDNPAEYPEPCIDTLTSVSFTTIDGIKHEIELNEKQSKFISGEFFTDQDYDRICSQLLEEQENYNEEFLD